MSTEQLYLREYSEGPQFYPVTRETAKFYFCQKAGKEVRWYKGAGRIRIVSKSERDKEVAIYEKNQAWKAVRDACCESAYAAFNSMFELEQRLEAKKLKIQQEQDQLKKAEQALAAFKEKYPDEE